MTENNNNKPQNAKHESVGQSSASAMVTLFVVSAVQFLTPFMMSAVGVALPTIGREFSASAVHLSLIETVYILAFSLFLLPAGRLGDIYGRKRIFTIGICIFTLGTLMVSLSFTLESFILFRFIQGSGGAMITGTSVAILSSVFPPAKRGRAMGIIVAFVYLGLSLGPVLSGFMVAHLGWRWIFYLGVIVEVTALFLTVFKLKGEWAESRGERFDILGAFIYCLSLLCLIVGALNQKQGGVYVALMIGGCIGLSGFLVFESRIKSPVLDVSLIFHNRVFAFSNLSTMINYAASFGIGFFFSLYLQCVRGYSPQAAGTILIVQPVCQTILSPFFGRLADRYSASILATSGMGLCVIGLGFATLVREQTPIYGIMAVLALMGAGFGMFSSPNMAVVMGSVAPRQYGIASGFTATMRTMGMLLCMTMITLVFNHIMGDHPVTFETRGLFLSSMHLSMVFFSSLSILGVLFSLGRIKPSVNVP
jgi:EmrB/QacA subfamily drug resistance transporter